MDTLFPTRKEKAQGVGAAAVANGNEVKRDSREAKVNATTKSKSDGVAHSKTSTPETKNIVRDQDQTQDLLFTGSWAAKDGNNRRL